jgi:putative Holliday junction resolvase
MIILAIDVGTVRVGCASGDTSVKIPFPVAVWERAQNRAEQALLSELAQRKAELLVVGLPLGPEGERTATCDSILAFVRRLSKRTSVKIVYVDESFSSHEAETRLKAAGATTHHIDAHAACLILEHYFASGGTSTIDPSSLE